MAKVTSSFTKKAFGKGPDDEIANLQPKYVQPSEPNVQDRYVTVGKKWSYTKEKDGTVSVKKKPIVTKASEYNKKKKGYDLMKKEK